MSKPFDVESLISQVEYCAQHNIFRDPFIRALPPRFKEGTHLNSWVGKVQLRDAELDGSEFEYGITDQIKDETNSKNSNKTKKETRNSESTFLQHVCSC